MPGSTDSLLGYPDDSIVAVLDLPQVNILHRVMRLGEMPRATRAIELHLFHPGDQSFCRPGIAFHISMAPIKSFAVSYPCTA